MKEKEEKRFILYGEKEIEYLKRKDKALKSVIEDVGYIYREIDTDLFSSIVHHIIGQQISSKALDKIWERLKDNLLEISPKSILSLGKEKLRLFGISTLKAERITLFAELVNSSKINLNSLYNMQDEEVIKILTKIPGVGRWTSEMILIFCLERPNILSYGDFGILKGLFSLHHHKKITKELFKRYQKRYSPYCSIASLYLWEIAAKKAT